MIFSQYYDSAAWLAAALGDERKARETIGAVPERHPSEAKYNQIASINWETRRGVRTRSDQVRSRQTWVDRLACSRVPRER
jgi:hypothetical protein